MCLPLQQSCIIQPQDKDEKSTPAHLAVFRFQDFVQRKQHLSRRKGTCLHVALMSTFSYILLSAAKVDECYCYYSSAGKLSQHLGQKRLHSSLGGWDYHTVLIKVVMSKQLRFTNVLNAEQRCILQITNSFFLILTYLTHIKCYLVIHRGWRYHQILWRFVHMVLCQPGKRLSFSVIARPVSIGLKRQKWV